MTAAYTTTYAQGVTLGSLLEVVTPHCVEYLLFSLPNCWYTSYVLAYSAIYK